METSRMGDSGVGDSVRVGIKIGKEVDVPSGDGVMPGVNCSGAANVTILGVRLGGPGSGVETGGGRVTSTVQAARKTASNRGNKAFGQVDFLSGMFIHSSSNSN